MVARGECPQELAIRRACRLGRLEEAATLTVQTYGPELMGFLVKQLRDHNLASDAFSEFSFDLWRGMGTFEGRSSVRVWSYAVLRHAMRRTLKRHRREQRLRIPLSEAQLFEDIAARVRSETLSCLRTAKRDRFARLCDRLSQDERTLLILRVNEGLEWKDVALVMSYDGQIPDAPVLQREAARLRKRFQLVKERLRTLARQTERNRTSALNAHNIET